MKMQEKAMVADALNSINSSLKTYTDMISQTENQQLRSTLQQMRNEAEQSQYELYQIAKNKNYYKPAGQASQNEINELKSTFSGNSSWAGSKGMSGGMGGSNLYGATGTNTGVFGTIGMSGNIGMTGSTSYSSGLTASQDALGLSGSSGMTANSGTFGDQGMSDNNIKNIGGMNSL
jgi:hypothetical protein